MRYQGGKSRFARRIVTAFEEADAIESVYYEPFCGSCAVLVELKKRHPDVQCFASDTSEDLILMWQALQDGWQPPRAVSEGVHKLLKHKTDSPSALRGFVGYCCSFGGGFFNTYARDRKTGRNFADESRRGLLKCVPHLKGVEFNHMDYRRVKPSGLVYADPPYVGLHRFRKKEFDNELFWKYMRRWSKVATVYVSEFIGPSDFESVWSAATVTTMAGGVTPNGYKRRTEHLFQLVGR